MSDAPRTSYSLSPAEIQMVQQIHLNKLSAKAKIFDLQVALEKARAELDAAEANMAGAVSIVAHAQGLKHATLTEDFTRLNGIPQEATK